VAAGELWADDTLVAEYGQDAADAAKAVALGVPRPGHSMLGRGLHLSTSQLNVSIFCGNPWVAEVSKRLRLSWEVDEWQPLSLGGGTFAAAEPAWVHLAERYCQQSREVREELAVYRAAGAGHASPSQLNLSRFCH